MLSVFYPRSFVTIIILSVFVLPLVLLSWVGEENAWAQRVIIRDPLGIPITPNENAFEENNPKMKGKKVRKIDQYDEWGYPPINFAIRNRDVDKLRQLLKQGANPNIIDSGGHSPLEIAGMMGSMESVKLLLQYGADISEENPEAYSDPAIAQLLRDKGAGKNLEKLWARLREKREKERATHHYIHVEGYEEALALEQIIMKAKEVGNFGTSIPILVLLEQPIEDIIEVHQKGSDINEKDQMFGTALQIAVSQNRNEDYINKLVDLGADPNQRSKDGKLLIMELVDDDKTKSVKHFIASGFDLKTHGTDLLSSSVYEGNIELVEFLLAKGVPTEHVTKGRMYPPFISAVMSDQIKNKEEMLRILLNAGADPNVKDSRKRNALAHVSLDRKNVPLIMQLIKAGTSPKDPSVYTAHNQTLIHYAVRINDKELFQAALQNGVSATTRDDSQISALHTAVVNGDPWFTRELLKAGAPVNKSVYSKGDTYADYDRVYKGTDDILAVAVSEGKNLEVVEILLKAGVNKDVRANDYDQGTALHMAIERGRNDMATAIIKAGAKLNTKDRYKRTPLHIAAWAENKEMIELLVKSGANVNAKDIDGHKPEDYIYRGLDNYAELKAAFNKKS
ncbi:MAG: ankyrin repeat domain-containing protein [Deltaproteobacteria bacterium]|jgi:ankyrin repeat protein|nr:ankyrin repeat domain-containing protein [Deltaproteobacteria bacterium]